METCDAADIDVTENKMSGNYEIAIIGGGPGGYVAAIRGAQHGKKIALIEGDEVGGTCLNRGCIPSKTLIKAAEIISLAKKASMYGIEFSQPTVDFKKLMGRKDTVVKTLVSGVKALLKANGVDVIKGVARFENKTTLTVTTPEGKQQVTADKILIASGSKPAALKIPGSDMECVIDSDYAFELEERPEKMVIIGGGVIGVEMAYIFKGIGTDVEIVEMLPRIVAQEDADASAVIETALKRNGIKINTGARVKSIEKSDGGCVTVFTAQDGVDKKIESNLVLMGVGRVPNTSDLGIEALGIEAQKGAIKVNGKMETSVPGIYAAGDAIGGIMLAHVAMEEAIVAVDNAGGSNEEMRYDHVPRCVYTIPEIAGAGLTEMEAAARNIPVKIGKFPFSASGKAATMGERDGFVKVIADAAGEKILGVLIAGAEATELIAEAVIAMKGGVTAGGLGETIHAHPTLSEAVKEAALAVSGKAIHFPPQMKK